ncbi:mRNA-degrading endonuclease YafQ of YafQ-DinJ toxin-antitoxin module [Nitrosomonas sp. Nm84]|uniref:type II toxin-antitoxin system RelE/ParE family toxin n=1 Tax=Nitrosomonas sp. Nm84 TaxID=200124 RepID=UPI000D762E85|nr:plasmid stabilization protein [Nitrosomonas sp. Nm84]PXW86859.1 mRNA-degrading endonuclease YafQ of YafQ-DinJ toxin-antitoxin module [Nitrosomonas sp. Nm84]
MSYTLIYTESYKKRAIRFAQKHPELKELYRKTLQLLVFNPYRTSLRIHSLRGKLAGLYSVSINLNYRITFELLIAEHEIILVNVGSNDEIYQVG